jgi:hypothetical protein
MYLNESTSCGTGHSGVVVSGTYTIDNAITGSGTITLSGGKSMYFKASKDLNTLLLHDNGHFMQGTAIRE